MSGGGRRFRGGGRRGREQAQPAQFGFEFCQGAFGNRPLGGELGDDLLELNPGGTGWIFIRKEVGQVFDHEFQLAVGFVRRIHTVGGGLEVEEAPIYLWLHLPQKSRPDKR